MLKYFEADKRRQEAPSRIFKQYKAAVRECREIERTLKLHVLHQAIAYIAKTTRLLFIQAKISDVEDHHALYKGEKGFKVLLYPVIDIDSREGAMDFDFYLAMPALFGGPNPFIRGGQGTMELSSAVAFKQSEHLKHWIKEQSVLTEKCNFIRLAENQPGMPKFKKYQKDGLGDISVFFYPKEGGPRLGGNSGHCQVMFSTLDKLPISFNAQILFRVREAGQASLFWKDWVELQKKYAMSEVEKEDA